MRPWPQSRYGREPSPAGCRISYLAAVSRSSTCAASPWTTETRGPAWNEPSPCEHWLVYFTNRWPGMAPGTTFGEVAERHAEAIRAHFGRPVDVLGASTGGSLALQLIADRPDVVRKAVVACAAYTLGPLAKDVQLKLLHAVEETGRYPAQGVLDLLPAKLRSQWLRALLTPVALLAAKRITIENPADTIAMLRAEDAFDVRDRLRDIPTETLVICGAQDPFWTLDMFAETACRMPRGKLIMYRDRGHALVTAPEFFSDVAAFLRSSPAS
jgi:pimeloyl-ACP methyl ester carboxylesterase